ncbi:MAG: hypothetical protein A2V52_04120, partial [Actinobacteria bacterium RBG_19FT_COMBO_54_7]
PVSENVNSCPKCGGKVRRVFHPVGIIFKGSGFYSTDYKSGSKPSGNGNGGDKLSPDKVDRELEKIKDEGSSGTEKKAEKSETASKCPSPDTK